MSNRVHSSLTAIAASIFAIAMAYVIWVPVNQVALSVEAQSANASTRVVLDATATRLAEVGERTLVIRATLPDPTATPDTLFSAAVLDDPVSAVNYNTTVAGIPLHEAPTIDATPLPATRGAPIPVTLYPTLAALATVGATAALPMPLLIPTTVIPLQPSSRYAIARSSVTTDPARYSSPTPITLLIATMPPSVTDEPRYVVTATPTPYPTKTTWPTNTPSPEPMPTPTLAPSPVPTQPPTETPKPSATPHPAPNTPASAPAPSVTVSPVPLPSASPSPDSSPTVEPSPTLTPQPSASVTPSPSATGEPTLTDSPTSAPTMPVPSETPTAPLLPTDTATITAIPIDTETPTIEPTQTPIQTTTSTDTPTLEPTQTDTSEPTRTDITVPTDTETPVP